MYHIKTGNSKLVGIGIFDLPTSVCLNSSQCAKECYAKKAERLYENTRKFRAKNLALSTNTKEFIPVMSKELTEFMTNRSNPVVRVHSSGDFYSQEYLDAWTTLAERFVTIKFYAYTKVTHLFNFDRIRGLGNFNIINSILPDGSINFGVWDEVYTKMRHYGGIICPATFNDNVKCGKHCSYCVYEDKVYFVKH